MLDQVNFFIFFCLELANRQNFKCRVNCIVILSVNQTCILISEQFGSFILAVKYISKHADYLLGSLTYCI